MNSISAEDLVKLLQERKVLLIDVREEYERDSFNIGGMHVPMEEAMQHNFQFTEGTPVVVYCEKGVRSGIVIQRLQVRYPVIEFLNLSGGMSGWKKAGFNSPLT